MKTLVKRAVGKVGKISFARQSAPPPPQVPRRNPYPIRATEAAAKSVVDNYWGDYTIKSAPYATARATLDFRDWRDKHFHKSYEFKGFWNDHSGEALLDYGCGPGYDVVGFLVYSKAAKVYAVDISYKVLSLAGHNVGSHNVAPDRIELDLTARIPLPDASVDYVHSCGVVHHTSKPEVILRHFNRVLKPGGKGLIMVYNRDSIFFRCHVAYARLILDPQFAGQTAEQVFVQSNDGPQCRISRRHEASEFSAPCEEAGFEVEYVGGSVASIEIGLWVMHGTRALQDPRLGEPHKSFLKELE